MINFFVQTQRIIQVFEVSVIVDKIISMTAIVSFNAIALLSS